MAFSIAFASLFLAQAAPAPPGIAIDFAAAEPHSAWFASALEEMVGREVGRFHRVQLAEKIDPALCPGHERACLEAAYEKSGVSVAVLGTLRGKKLRYAIYDTFSHTAASEGVVAAEGLTRTALERRISDIIRPIVGSGGLVDQRGQAASLESASDLFLPIATGMLWGVFMLVNLGFVFAPAYGLSRIRHHALGTLLASWLAMSTLRALVLLAYLPIFLMLEDSDFFVVAFPSACLALDLLFLGFVRVRADRLDRALVLGPASERNPWHTTIKRYFMGYVRRTGVELDRDLLERTLFLPAKGAGVTSYGGGFARPRILVGEKLRDLALGELPDEDELPERAVNPDELPYGFLVPGADPSAELRRALAKAPPKPRGHIPRLLGEHATLLGFVMPQTGGQSVPLIANTREDFEVVKKLLTNHYAAFETNEDEDNVDDTDPSQLDLLFGALLREVGAIRRKDTLFAAIRGMALIRPFAALYDRLLGGPAERVADAYAALNHALHHLIQYRYFQQGGSELLTARADVPRLLRSSKEILDRARRTQPARSLTWLSELFHQPIAGRGDRRTRALAALAVALALFAILGKAAKDASDYHPTYVDRMAQSSGGAANDDRDNGHH
jgi:hypothetical protein